MTRASRLEALIVFAAAVALAVALTWPVAARFGSGGRVDSGDGRQSIWYVAWIARTLVADPANVFDANIFHPFPRTLAYTEANLVAGALAVPVYWATRNPYASHNFVFLLSFVLSAVAAYALARYLTGSRLAAAFASIAFAYTPFVFAHTAHIQLLLSFGLPASALAMHSLVDRPTAGRALTLGVSLGVTALACSYYGIFAAMVVGLGTLFYAKTRRLWASVRYWIVVCLAAGLAVALVMPVLLIYLSLQAETGFARTLVNAELYSADWRSYLTSAAWAHRWMLPLVQRWKEVLFPGFLPIVLAAPAIWFAVRRPAHGADGRAGADRREHVVFYALVLGLAFWFSFGPSAGLYSALFHAFPVFSFLRAPARIVIVCAMALAVLAAFGVERLIARLSGRRGAIAGAGLVVLLAAELVTVPLRTFPARHVSKIYATLASLPRGAVAEFPFYYENLDFHHHTIYMLFSTYHWQPIMNGYSDHIPKAFRDTARVASTFPSPEGFALLRERGVRYVVFHLDLYATLPAIRVQQRLEMYKDNVRLIHRDSGVLLYEIVKWPDR